MSEPVSFMLHYLLRSAITAQQAVDAFCAVAMSASDRAESAVGFLSTPRAYRIVRICKSSITGSSGGEVSLNDVFEIKAFTPNIELRWLNESGGLGRAAIVSEDESITVPEWEDQAHEVELVHPSDRLYRTQYLFWGRVHLSSAGSMKAASGWTVLTEGRIGELAVPISDGQADQRVALRYREYLSMADEDGNMCVLDERLTGLEFVGSSKG